MGPLWLLTKGRCDSCGKGERYLVVVHRETAYISSLQDVLDAGYRICRPCILGLQSEAALLARFEPRPAPGAAKSSSKPAKKGAKQAAGAGAGALEPA
ncbi:MAG: hypothetical protein ACREKK_00480 [Candidatus Methylomirabilales bacterium]